MWTKRDSSIPSKSLIQNQKNTWGGSVPHIFPYIRAMFKKKRVYIFIYIYRYISVYLYIYICHNMYMYMYAASVLGCLVLDLNHRGTCHHPYSKNNYSNYRFFPSSDIRSMLHCKTKKKQVNFGLSRRGSPFRSQVVSYHINHTKKSWSLTDFFHLPRWKRLPPSTELTARDTSHQRHQR